MRFKLSLHITWTMAVWYASRSHKKEGVSASCIISQSTRKSNWSFLEPETQWEGCHGANGIVIDGDFDCVAHCEPTHGAIISMDLFRAVLM